MARCGVFKEFGDGFRDSWRPSLSKSGFELVNVHCEQSSITRAYYICLDAVSDKKNLVRLQIEPLANEPINLGLGFHQADLKRQNDRIRRTRQAIEQSARVWCSEIGADANFQSELSQGAPYGL